MLDVAVSFLTTGVLPAVGILVTLGVLNLSQRRPGEFAIPVIATLLCFGILLLLWPPSIFTYLIVVPAVGFGMLLVWSTALGAKQRFLDRLYKSGSVIGVGLTAALAVAMGLIVAQLEGATAGFGTTLELIAPMIVILALLYWKRRSLAVFAMRWSLRWEVARHVRAHGLPPGLTADHSGLERYLAMLTRAFSDLHIESNHDLREGDRRAVRVTVRGTHTGVLEGALVAWPQDIPPTGRRMSWSETTIYRYEQGKIVELWDSVDRWGLLRELGVVQDIKQAAYSEIT